MSEALKTYLARIKEAGLLRASFDLILESKQKDRGELFKHFFKLLSMLHNMNFTRELLMSLAAVVLEYSTNQSVSNALKNFAIFSTHLS